MAWPAGATGAAARVTPGWHPCGVPGSGSPAAERPRGGMDTAASRPFGQSVERSFYCRSCQLTARGRWIPADWYVLERAVGGGGRHRVGDGRRRAMMTPGHILALLNFVGLAPERGPAYILNLGGRGEKRVPPRSGAKILRC